MQVLSNSAVAKSGVHFRFRFFVYRKKKTLKRAKEKCANKRWRTSRPGLVRLFKIAHGFLVGYVRLISVCTMSVTCIVGLSRTVTRFPGFKMGMATSLILAGENVAAAAPADLTCLGPVHDTPTL